ncbi:MULTISPECIES: hypothetical protein [unclassified Janthinobacterium]|uniref:hypothetical protein n=1 Tax=unclassified Janthinobacterium TaxID=2610881 RepID=UPI00160B730C|nr:MULTISPECIES: hypothetical protein [unclassified Janthinobacterium]MBB5608672.1 hypothetical protein [Janthinobacterium sp. S3T4]MBB5613925.1 hypothetical protein [Janthinobacterium sp. S3M3]
MKNTILPILFSLIACSMLYGCTTTQPEQPLTAATAPAVDAACTVSATVFSNHIKPRHCAAAPLPGVNQLLPEYCTDAAAAQSFCRMVQNAPNKNRVVQADGRVRYDANLGKVVGTAGEKCGRLIMTSPTDGAVVTEFPETNNAPAPCL